MSNFSKFKTNSYCVGGRNYSGLLPQRALKY